MLPHRTMTAITHVDDARPAARHPPRPLNPGRMEGVEQPGIKQLAEAQAVVCERIQAALHAVPAEDVEKREALLNLWKWHHSALDKYSSWLHLEESDEMRDPAFPPAPAAAATIDLRSTPTPSHDERSPLIDLEYGLPFLSRKRGWDLMLEIGVLICCTVLVLYTFSGPRSIFATCTLATAIWLVFDARTREGQATACPTQEGGSRSEVLRSRLALLYLAHWTLDLLHLCVGAHAAAHTVLIGNGLMRAVAEIALIFSLCTAITGADAGPNARTTIGRLLAAQGALGARAYVAYSKLSTAQLPWGPTAANDFLITAMGAEVFLPMLTAFLGWAAATYWERRQAET